MGLFNRRSNEQWVPVPRRKGPKKNKVDRLAEQVIADKMRNDPAYAEQVAKSRLNLTFPTVDPVEQANKRMEQKVLEALSEDKSFIEAKKIEYRRKYVEQPSLENELDSFVTSQAIDQLRKDPELLADAIANKVADLMGSGKSRGGSTMAALVRQLDDLEALRDRLGDNESKEKSNPLLALLSNPDVIKAFAPVLSNLASGFLGGGAKQLDSPKVYVVQTQDGIREMNAEQYKAFLEGTTKPAIEAPKQTEQKPTAPPIAMKSEQPQKVEEPPVIVKPIELNVETSSGVTLMEPYLPELKEEIVKEKPKDTPASEQKGQPSLKLSEWVPWLDKTPSEFVDHLEEQVDDPNVRLAVSYLLQLDYTQLKAALESIKPTQPEEIQATIDKVLAHEEWVTKVIEIVKSRYS